MAFTDEIKKIRPNNPIVLILCAGVCGVICYFVITALIKYYNSEKMDLASLPAALPAQVNTVYVSNELEATAFRTQLFNMLDDEWTKEYNRVQQLLSGSLGVTDKIANTILQFDPNRQNPKATWVSPLCWPFAEVDDKGCQPGWYPESKCYSGLQVDSTANTLSTELTKLIVDKYNLTDKRMKDTKPILTFTSQPKLA
jgi:amino acid transporter